MKPTVVFSSPEYAEGYLAGLLHRSLADLDVIIATASTRRLAIAEALTAYEALYAAKGKA